MGERGINQYNVGDEIDGDGRYTDGGGGGGRCPRPRFPCSGVWSSLSPRTGQLKNSNL